MAFGLLFVPVASACHFIITRGDIYFLFTNILFYEENRKRFIYLVFPWCDYYRDRYKIHTLYINIIHIVISYASKYIHNTWLCDNYNIITLYLIYLYI